MKKLIYSALAFAATSPLALLAEETGSGTSDVTASGLAEGLVSAAGESLTGMLDTVAPVIVTVVVAGLAIWGGIALVGMIKRGFNAGKGR